MRTKALLLFLLLLSVGLRAEPLGLRVGVLFFQDETDPLAKLGEFARVMPAEISTSYAIGTYGELADWLDRGLVDVAVTTVCTEVDPPPPRTTLCWVALKANL